MVELRDIVQEKMPKQPGFITVTISVLSLKGFLTLMCFFCITCLHSLGYSLSLPTAVQFPCPQPYRIPCSATCRSLGKFLSCLLTYESFPGCASQHQVGSREVLEPILSEKDRETEPVELPYPLQRNCLFKAVRLC